MRRYIIHWTIAGPHPLLKPDGPFTWAEVKEQLVGWHVTQAEWWLGMTEEDYNAEIPF
jgi:hypothetical protein